MVRKYDSQVIKGLMWLEPWSNVNGVQFCHITLANSFNVVQFCQVKWQGNFATHNIAKHARHVREITVWMEDVFPHISTVILADLADFH